MIHSLRLFLTHLPLLLSMLLILGCATPTSPPTAEPAQIRPKNTPLEASPLSQLDPSQFPAYNGLNQSLLLALLSAEIAGQRYAVDLALEIYLELTLATRHPALAERTTWIAQFAEQPEAALDAALIWASQATENPDAQRAAAGLLLQNEQYLDAFEFLYRFEQLGGGSNYTLLASSMIESQQPGISDLYRRLEAATPHPDTPASDYTTALALLSYEMGDLNQARVHIQATLAADPRHLRTLQLQARLLRETGELDQAQALLSRALTEQPDQITLWLELARTQLAARQYEAAEASFDQLIQQEPDHPQAYLALARIQLELGEYARAEQTLLRLVDLDPHQDQAWLLLGQLAEREDQTQQALHYYRQVGGGQTLLDASFATLRLLDTPNHTPELLRFLRLKQIQHPELALELTLIGEYRLRSEAAYQAALDWLDESAQRFPEIASRSELLYSRAMLFYFLNDLSAMEAELREILHHEPHHAQALNALGYTLVDRTDRIHEGLLLIQRAHALDSTAPEILDSLGWAMYRLGRYEEAREYLEEAYARLQDEEIALHLIHTLMALELPEEAQTLLDRLPASQPASADLEALLDQYPELRYARPASQDNPSTPPTEQERPLD